MMFDYDERLDVKENIQNLLIALNNEIQNLGCDCMMRQSHPFVKLKRINYQYVTITI